MSTAIAKRFLVSGRVQGVFFRASTQQQANRLGLTGHALNQADGRVEVLVRGNPAAVGELAEWLQVGPPAARVISVEELPVEEMSARDSADFRCG